MNHNNIGCAIVAGLCTLFFAMIVLAIGFVALANADEEEARPPFLLMMTVHVPGNKPDSHRNMPMKSLDECWESAKAFVEGMTVPEGAVGISAACGKYAEPKSDPA